MATLATLRSRVASNHGARTDKNTEIDAIINLVVDDLANKFLWPDLMVEDTSATLTATGYTVTIPSTIRRVELVRIKDSNNNYYEPDFVSRKAFREHNPDNVPPYTGTPNMCFQLGRTLYFNYKADVNYTVYIDGFKYAVAMTADGNSPSLTGVDEVIIALATGHLYIHLNRPNEAGSWFEVASQFMQSHFDEVFGKSVDHLEPY